MIVLYDKEHDCEVALRADLIVRVVNEGEGDSWVYYTYPRDTVVHKLFIDVRAQIVADLVNAALTK